MPRPKSKTAPKPEPEHKYRPGDCDGTVHEFGSEKAVYVHGRGFISLDCILDLRPLNKRDLTKITKF
jgi:hypothetical protein